MHLLYGQALKGQVLHHALDVLGVLRAGNEHLPVGLLVELADVGGEDVDIQPTILDQLADDGLFGGLAVKDNADGRLRGNFLLLGQNAKQPAARG